MISEESIFQVHCAAGNISVVKEMVMSGIWKFKYNWWKYVDSFGVEDMNISVFL